MISEKTENPGEPDETSALPASLRRVLLLVSYNGTAYKGFARQGDVPTVADTLQPAIRDIDPEASFLTASSRTDAGVHAENQPVSFITTRDLHARGWVLALASRLPPDISIVRASFVPLDFDPRSNPIWKRYRYRVFCSQVEDPFLSPYSWRVGNALDLPLMKEEAASLVGEHDFSAFRHVDDNREVTIRRLDVVDIDRSVDDARCLDIHVQGNRFLYNMVRIIAGTLIDVGRGRKKPGASLRAIATGDRRELGMTAPPQGLRLMHVELQDWGEEHWPPADGSFFHPSDAD